LKSLVQGPQGFGCDFVDLSNRHRCRRKFYPLSPSLISSFFEIVLPYQQKPPFPFALRSGLESFARAFLSKSPFEGLLETDSLVTIACLA
jgi:hypothetical protein